MHPRLLIATSNPGKLREYRSLLHDVPFGLVSLQDARINLDVAETGQTYVENAILKAATLAEASGLLTLADDSGLEVDALGGEPGVRSARYAGDNATDADRIRYLLSRLHGVPPEKRTARFVCVIAIARPDGHADVVSGEVGGLIATAPRGHQGHGYDPVFVVPELGKTMAELSPEQKDRISHRGHAATKARQLLLSLRS